MKTSLKAGFAQIFSCCPKKLSCPKFGGAAAPLIPPVRTPMCENLHCQENCVWPSLKCHTSPPPNLWGARLSPPRPSRIMGWRQMTFQTTYGHLRSSGD